MLMLAPGWIDVTMEYRMRLHEHLPPSDHEPNWDDREKFGPFGYQIPHIADVYASGYELDQLTRARGDDCNNNPYHGTPENLYDELMRSFALSHISSAARYFFRSPRAGHRVFAAEFLAAKQSRTLDELEQPRVRRGEGSTVSGQLDPDVEMGPWLLALEEDNAAAVLEEYWDFIGMVAHDDDARGHVPRDLRPEDFEPVLSAAYSRMMTASRKQAQ